MYDLLKGLRVVEGAAFIAGPSCGLHLLQMGAEVIRFDQIGGGPDFHRWPVSPISGASLYWEGLNKGKKSVALDLGRPEGRELAQRLAVSGDENGGLFVTNYPVAGFLAHERLKALRDDLISLRVMGWADGRPAVDYTVNAAIGIPAMTGPVESSEPVNHVLPAWDLLAGAYSAFALVSAERRRRLTGEGAEIRLPLSDMAAASLSHLGQVAEVLTTDADRERGGNALFGAFGRDFQIADGRRVMIVAITPRQWRGLVEVLDLQQDIAAIEARTGADFTAREGDRYTCREEVFPLFERALWQRTEAQLQPVFAGAGVCWAPYATLKQAVAETWFTGKNAVFAEVSHPSGHTYPTAGSAATLGGEPRGVAPSAPRLGEHTDEVLADCLGLSSGEIGRLHDQGLVCGANEYD